MWRVSIYRKTDKILGRKEKQCACDICKSIIKDNVPDTKGEKHYYVIKDATCNSVRETLRNFKGHSVLFGETVHRTEYISVWLRVYIVYIVLEATLDISVRLEMRQIGPITYLSCRFDGLMNLADTVVRTEISFTHYFVIDVRKPCTWEKQSGHWKKELLNVSAT